MQQVGNEMDARRTHPAPGGMGGFRDIRSVIVANTSQAR